MVYDVNVILGTAINYIIGPQNGRWSLIETWVQYRPIYLFVSYNYVQWYMYATTIDIINTPEVQKCNDLQCQRVLGVMVESILKFQK